MIAAGFSYQVITAHNGCLQLEVTVHGKMAHAAVPETGVDALQGADQILTALYAQNDAYKSVMSKVEGITHPYLNVGQIAGGTNTNVVPGKVTLQAGPPDDPRRKPGRSGSHAARGDRQSRGTVHGRSQASRSRSSASCWRAR